MGKGWSCPETPTQQKTPPTRGCPIFQSELTAEKLPCPFFLGVIENLLRCAAFEDVSFVHEENPVGDFAGEGHFVRDDDHGHAFFGEFFHGEKHFADELGIESGCRFIKEHDVGLHGEGSGNGDPLLLPAG